MQIRAKVKQDLTWRDLLGEAGSNNPALFRGDDGLVLKYELVQMVEGEAGKPVESVQFADPETVQMYFEKPLSYRMIGSLYRDTIEPTHGTWATVPTKYLKFYIYKKHDEPIND